MVAPAYRPKFSRLFLPRVVQFHQPGKHNQLTHGHSKAGRALYIGEQVTTPKGVGTLSKLYQDLEWGYVDGVGKKKWFKVDEIEPVNPPSPKQEWKKVNTGGMLEVGQAIKTPNGVGSFVKTAHDKDGYWVQANVPGQKKSWYLAKDVEAGVSNGVASKFRTGASASGGVTNPAASVGTAKPASTISGSKVYIPGKGTATVTEVQGNWVKVEGAGKKKWYKQDEVNFGGAPTPSPTVVSTTASTGAKHPATKVGTPPTSGHEYSTKVWEQKSWQDHISKWPNTLTGAELSAVSSYTSSGYMSINSALRHGTPSGSTLVTIKNLDSALAKSTAPEHMVVYRGVSGKVLEGLKVGSVFSDKGYLSTSTSEGGAFSGAKLTIRIPKGSTGAYVDPISSVKGEREWLLPRGSRLRVVSQTGFGNSAKFVMELIP